MAEKTFLFRKIVYTFSTNTKGSSLFQWVQLYKIQDTSISATLEKVLIDRKLRRLRLSTNA